MKTLWALLDVLVFIGAEVSNERQESTKCSCDAEAIWINQGAPQANLTFAPVTLIPSPDGCDLTVRCNGLYPLSIATYYSKTIDGNCADLDPDDTAILAHHTLEQGSKSNSTYDSLDFNYLRCIEGNWKVYLSDTEYLAENGIFCDDPTMWVMYNNVFCVQPSSKAHSTFFPELPAAEPLQAPTSATPPALTPKQCTISITPPSTTTVACLPSASTVSTKRPPPFSSTTTTQKSDSTTSTSTSTIEHSTTTPIPMSTTTIKLEETSTSSSTSTSTSSTTTANKLDTTSTSTSSHSPTTVPNTTTTTKMDSACVDGFQLVNASYVGDGHAGGYFSHENSCKELCANNFGMRKCLGYAFEPDSRGKCTLLERINLIRTSEPGTKRLVVKC